MNSVLTDFFSGVLPVLLQLVGLVLAGLIGQAAQAAKARWGIEIEARHREALHSALLSGATAAITRQLGWDDAKEAVLAYLRRSVPEALAALDPDYQVLDDLVQGKLREAAIAAQPLASVQNWIAGGETSRV